MIQNLNIKHVNLGVYKRFWVEYKNLIDCNNETNVDLLLRKISWDKININCFKKTTISILS